MNNRSTYLYRSCFVFCSGHFEFLICGLLVRAVWRRRSPRAGNLGQRRRIRKWQGIKLLTSFRRKSLLVGGNVNACSATQRMVWLNGKRPIFRWAVIENLDISREVNLPNSRKFCSSCRWIFLEIQTGNFSRIQSDDFLHMRIYTYLTQVTGLILDYAL